MGKERVEKHSGGVFQGYRSIGKLYCMYTQQISVYCIPIDPDALTTPPPPPKLDELWHDAPPPLGTPDPSPSIHPENPISPLSVA